MDRGDFGRHGAVQGRVGLDAYAFAAEAGEILSRKCDPNLPTKVRIAEERLRMDAARVPAWRPCSELCVRRPPSNLTECSANVDAE